MIAVWLKTVSLFSDAEKLRIGFLFLCSVLIGIVQVAGIASIMPFIAALTSPGLVESQPLFSRLYDLLGFDNYRSYVIALGVFCFCILIVTHILELTYSWISVRFINLKEYDLSTALLRSYLTDKFERTSNRNTSELSKNILQDVESVISGILFSGMGIVNSSISTVFIIALLLFMDPWITLSLACVFVVCYGIIFLLLSPTIRKLGADVKDFYSQMFVSTQQALDGLKEIKANNREAYFVQRYAEPRRASALNFIRFKTLEMIPTQLLEVTAFGSVIAVSVYLVYRGDAGGLNYPIIAMFAFAAYRIVPMVRSVFDGMESFNYYRSFLDGIWDDLNRVQTAAIPVDSGRPAKNIASIELRGIHYRYQSSAESALNGIELHISAGERLCLIGASGAGKTTTVDILLGLLAPEKGEIRVNGQIVAGDTYRSVRERIGYVPQDPYLLDETLLSNITFGEPVLDKNRLAWAYEAAGLTEVFGESSEAAAGVLIGQHGGRLSGGQRQRIAIARALYKNPDLLVLDESTNGLDLVMEQQFLNKLATLTDISILFVSHRPSVMKACQRLVVIDKGKVVATGTYDELANSEHHKALLI